MFPLLYEQNITSIVSHTTDWNLKFKAKILSQLLPIKHFWHANWIRIVPREGKREKYRGCLLKYNLMSPICHSYIWKHIAADLFVEMKWKQSKGNFFFLISYNHFNITSKQQAERQLLPSENVAPFCWLHEVTESLITPYMRKCTHAKQFLMIQILRCKARGTPWIIIFTSYYSTAHSLF